MAFNLKVYLNRYDPFQHPYLTFIDEQKKELESQCDDQYTQRRESNLEQEMMDEEVKRQFTNNLKKLDIL
jgi:SPX domain protein involved in polyphosphate accumulation